MKDNLVRRQVIPITDTVCITGCGGLETSAHLFLLFFDKAKRKVRHPVVVEASQLGWHPTATPSCAAFPIRIY